MQSKNCTCAGEAWAKIAIQLGLECELPVSGLFHNKTVKLTRQRWENSLDRWYIHMASCSANDKACH